MKKKALKIIFFGSSQISLEILDTLLKTGYDLACVITQADKKAGRHLELKSTPVKIYAQKRGLEVLSPELLSDAHFLEKLSGFNSDIFIVVSYGKILPLSVLKIPRLFALNIHTSLLPKYRGAAPIARAIMAGEVETGVTIIRMNERIDEGDIISQGKLPITMADNAITLDNKLGRLAGEEILKVLKLIEDNKLRFSKQDSSKISYAPKLTKNDGLIDWKKEAATIYNQIRGCLPWPVAFTFLKGKRTKIFKARLEPLSSFKLKAGQIIALKEGIISVAADKGAMGIEELQLENSKRLRSAEFISGFRLKVGDYFG